MTDVSIMVGYLVLEGALARPLRIEYDESSVMYRKIGGLFQGLTYSSGVAKANHRSSLRLSRDKGLKKTVENSWYGVTS